MSADLLRARWANADSPLAAMIVEVVERTAPGGPPAAGGLRFFVFEELDDALVVGPEVWSTVDLRSPLTPAEWEAEYGGIASFAELRELVREAKAKPARDEIRARD